MEPKYSSIELFKSHLNLDYCDANEEAYLKALLCTAEKRIEKEIQQPFDKFVKEGTLEEPLLFAVLIFAGTMYNSREAVSYGVEAKPIPFTLMFLIQPYINYS